MRYSILCFQLFTTLLLGFSTLAQVNQLKRVEIVYDGDFVEQGMESFGEEGLILKSRSDDPSNGKYIWKYEKYNTNLELKQNTTITVDRKYNRRYDIVFKDDYASYFQNKKGEFIIHNLNVGSMQGEKISGVLPKGARHPLEIKVLGEYCYLDLSIKKERFLYVVNRFTGSTKFYPLSIDGYSKRKVSLWNMQLLEKSNELLLYLKAYKGRHLELYVKKFDLDAKEYDTYKLTSTIEQNLISISATKTGYNEYVFVGTYSSKQVNTSIGLYFLRVMNDKLMNSNFHPYASLEDFFSFLPERRQEKIERKRDRKQSKGKDLIINYMMASHNVIPIGDNYGYVGEAHYPTYRIEYYTAYDANGNAITKTRRVFDGYQYTHAIVAKFDQNGNIMWDRIFEMWPSYKPYYHKRFISLNEKVEHNEIKLVFPSATKISSKSFDYDGNITSDENTEFLIDKKEGDKTKRISHEMSYWHDNYFLSYGYEKIKNKLQSGGSKKREVYFLVKVAF